MENTQNFMGFEYIWWQGVVEDRLDPLKIGRCRVRILGFHTENKNKIPTNDLPWAYPATPINSEPDSTPTGPREGTWVMGFFRDGRNAQEPVMTHQIDSGMVNKNVPSKGFNDPETNSAKPDKPLLVSENDVGEMNTHKLAVGTTTGTMLGNNTLIKEGDVGLDGKKFIEEPETKYAAAYPYNKVTESESGHVLEVDDTKGAERISITHRSGTFYEIHPDGGQVVKITGKNYELTLDEKNVHIKGDLNINIGGRTTEISESKVIKSTDSIYMSTDTTSGTVGMNTGYLSITTTDGITLTGDVHIKGSLVVDNSIFVNPANQGYIQAPNWFVSTAVGSLPFAPIAIPPVPMGAVPNNLVGATKQGETMYPIISESEIKSLAINTAATTT